MNSNCIKIIKKRAKAILPARATNGSAGLDLFACIDEKIILEPGQSVLVPTGVAIELPSADMAAFIFARSGLSVKFGVALSNSVGVVDSDYRGEIFVSLKNFSNNSYEIKCFERIAQLIVMPVCCLPLMEVVELSDTFRGESGFGSTGK